jgi:ketosteroid isomerase-like protein
MNDEELKRLEQWLDEANTRMLDGDWSLWRDKLSRREDVTVLGAYGAYLTGWGDVLARFERTAAGYAGGGGHSTHETIASWMDSDLACIVTLERHHTQLDGKPATFRYRTTHVFRREDGDWKVILRHADPLATFLGPQFAHFTTQTEDVA